MAIENFITKPSTMKISNAKAKFHSLMPSEHRIVLLKNETHKSLNQLCSKEGVGEQINVNEYLSFNSGYYLGTIGCMDNIIYDETQGEKISPLIYNPSTKKLSKGNFIISRNASLGKISYLNEEKKVILNGGISYFEFAKKYNFYVPAFFITTYGTDYLTCITSGGGTQQNAKRGTLLSVPIPLPTKTVNANPDDVIEFVSSLVKNIIDKQEQVNKKAKHIDEIILQELNSNQSSKKFQYSITKISELSSNSLRFDSGMYSLEYKKLKHLISNYANGFFNIPFEKLKSGSTPDIRIFGVNAKYKWVTPTNISDAGFFNEAENISMPTDNNLNSDAVLFINRTSKGKKGEYVGIACLYDLEYYGSGHHNQGIYRVEDYSAIEKQFIVAFMNSTIMRKICGYTSLGTKMKEMKMNDFANLIFPNFTDSKRKQIAKEYFCKEEPNKDLTLANYFQKEKRRNEKIGIFQLNAEINTLRFKLAELVDKIIKEEPIKIVFQQ